VCFELSIITLRLQALSSVSNNFIYTTSIKPNKQTNHLQWILTAAHASTVQVIAADAPAAPYGNLL
jgi:hypothetical protein